MLHGVFFRSTNITLLLSFIVSAFFVVFQVWFFLSPFLFPLLSYWVLLSPRSLLSANSYLICDLRLLFLLLYQQFLHFLYYFMLKNACSHYYCCYLYSCHFFSFPSVSYFFALIFTANSFSRLIMLHVWLVVYYSLWNFYFCVLSVYINWTLQFCLDLFDFHIELSSKLISQFTILMYRPLLYDVTVNPFSIYLVILMQFNYIFSYLCNLHKFYFLIIFIDCFIISVYHILYQLFTFYLPVLFSFLYSWYHITFLCC